jgi:hypothetical protein
MARNSDRADSGHTSSSIRAGQTELPEDVAMRNHLTGPNFGASIHNGACIAFGNGFIVDRRA